MTGYATTLKEPPGEERLFSNWLARLDDLGASAAAVSITVVLHCFSPLPDLGMNKCITELLICQGIIGYGKHY